VARETKEELEQSNELTDQRLLYQSSISIAGS